MSKIFIMLITAVFLIRFIALDQSLWLDEGTTAQVIQKFGYSQIVTLFSPNDFHPPFYYLFMKFWTSFFGDSEIALRLPSIMFSLLSAWFIYRLVHRSSQKKAMWAALFFLLNPLILYYSQEARMYLMVTCFLTIVTYLFFEILQSDPLKRQLKKTVLFDLFLALSLFTFYGSVFYIASLYLYLFYSKKFKHISLLIPGTTGALFLLAPLLFQQYSHAKEMLHLVPNWSLVLGNVSLKNLLLIPMKFAIGRIQWEPKTFYYAVAGLWTAVVFYFTYKGALRNKAIAFFFIVPIILGTVFSFVTPLLQYFRFVYLIPLLAILTSLGTSKTWQRILVGAGFLGFSLIYLLNTAYHREDWKNLSNAIPDRSEVYMVFTSSDPLQYYFRRRGKTDVKIFDLSRIDEKVKNGREIIVIPYTSDIHGIDYRTNLETAGFQKMRERSFRGVSIEWWQKMVFARTHDPAFADIQ